MVRSGASRTLSMLGVWLQVGEGEVALSGFYLSGWHPGLLLWVQLNLHQRKKCRLLQPIKQPLLRLYLLRVYIYIYIYVVIMFGQQASDQVTAAGSML